MRLESTAAGLIDAPAAKSGLSTIVLTRRWFGVTPSAACDASAAPDREDVALSSAATELPNGDESAGNKRALAFE